MKLKLFMVISSIFFLILSLTFVNAETCEKSEILEGLKKSLYFYYFEPDENTLTREELIDLVNFYLNPSLTVN